MMTDLAGPKTFLTLNALIDGVGLLVLLQSALVLKLEAADRAGERGRVSQAGSPVASDGAGRRNWMLQHVCPASDKVLGVEDAVVEMFGLSWNHEVLYSLTFNICHDKLAHSGMTFSH